VAAPAFRYRAFLSYSHADKVVGERLHGDIEGYAIPAGLAAPDGAAPLPSSLRPIFRDKFDLEAGHSLREQIRQALGESAALIVLCSPHAAGSPYVNEEIRLFKAAGGAARIFPVIVAGRPGDPAAECFPPMLRSEVAPDGTVGGPGDEPIAADVREEADGWELATLKVIAGLLGVDLDQLRRRDAVDRRRRLRRSRALAAAMTVLAIAASGLAVWAWSLNTKLAAALLRETAAHAEATRRYDEALNSTLKLVTVAASLRSVLAQRPFSVSMVQGKGESQDFQDYLAGIGDPDRVWFQLVKVLMGFEEHLPPELTPFRPQLEAAGMPLQWAQHAAVITENLIARTRGRPGRERELAAYEQELATIRAEIARPRP
jgi:hypothetical protein